jgi:hypothetical protein
MPPSECRTDSYAGELKQITGPDMATKLADLTELQLEAVASAIEQPMANVGGAVVLIAASLWAWSAGMACAADAGACHVSGDTIEMHAVLHARSPCRSCRTS